jgi:hypothetical protein
MNYLAFFEDHQLRLEPGYPMGSFFGYKVIGYFEDAADVAKSPVQTDAAPGRFKYFDANGDGQITDADRIHFGNPNPKYTAGLNLGLTYKNFDFTTFFYACVGNDIYNSYKGNNNAFVDVPLRTALYNSWTPENHNAQAPIQELNPMSNFSTAGVWNSYPVEKGSYLRNKTMIIGYNFPGNWLKKIRIEKLRVYIQAANLFTITKYSGLDPELNNRLLFSNTFQKATGSNSNTSSAAFGVDVFGTYPNNQKQYLFGLNVGF